MRSTQRDVVRGQYRGYEKVDGVQPGSDTETFVALRFVIENWRWAGVPVFVRAGKALPVTATEIVVRLQQVPELRYGSHRLASPGFDDIVFRIGRDAGMTIDLFAKTPGKEETRGVSLDVSFVEELGDVAADRTSGCSPTPCEAIRRSSPAGTSSRRRGGSCSRCSTLHRRSSSYRRGTWGPRRARDALARRVWRLARAAVGSARLARLRSR